MNSTSTAIFEDHDERMKDIPIIFHKDMSCTHNKPYFINWHINIELIRITNGSGAVLLGEKFIYGKTNDVIVINSNVAHGFITDDYMEYDCLIINREYMLKNGFDTSACWFTEHIINDQELNRLISSVKNIFCKEVQLLEIGATILPTLLYLRNNYTEPQVNSEFESNIIKKAISFMLTNIKNDLSLDDIAEHIGISKYYFIRKFKATTGYTPLQYLTVQRCNLAKVFLKEGLPVKEVAERCGFENASYFSKVFFMIIGIKPTEFKKRST